MRKRKLACMPTAFAACALLLSSCALSVPELPRTQAYLDAEARRWASYDLAEEAGVVFEDLVIPEEKEPDEIPPETVPETEPNRVGEPESAFRMRVYEEMPLYSGERGGSVTRTLPSGSVVRMTLPSEAGGRARVEDEEGELLGWAQDGFLRAVDAGCELYAELPVEYGTAKTNDGSTVAAHSHLVDIRRYFKTVEAQDGDFSNLDLGDADFIISMKLSTNETSIGEPFYHRNLCLLQYDILPMMKKAADRFREDGYTIVIYDAYRPTSVQQRWFDVVRVHKWVADPSIGMGGIHDRGTAVDISLVDKNGRELEMPTPMHTFTEASARSSPIMSETARANMNYMLNVMVSCGFTYINSEWWHFQDVNTVFYLPTDHPLDEVTLTAGER